MIWRSHWAFTPQNSPQNSPQNNLNLNPQHLRIYQQRNLSLMLYLTLEAGLLRAKERAGISGTAEDAFLTELLQLSAGKDPDGTTHYRPFLVAARWLEQNQSAQAISKADGVEFTGLRTPIVSLLNLQAGYDMACNLTVPDGFGVSDSNRPFRFPGTRSHPTRILP